MKLILKLSVLIAGLVTQTFGQSTIATQQRGIVIGINSQKAASSDSWAWVEGQVGESSLANHKSWAPGAGIDTMLANCKFAITVRTVTPSKPVNAQLVVDDTLGSLMFEGYTSTTATQVNGVWTLPKEAGDITLNIAYMNKITLDDEISYANTIDADGKPYGLAVNGKDLYFPRESLGLKGAYLQVTFTNGKTRAWTIETGVELISVPLSVSTTAKLANFAGSFKNPTVAGNNPATVVIPTSITSSGKGGANVISGISPAIEVEMTTSGSAWIKVSTDKGGQPVGVTVVNSNGKITTPTINTVSSGGFTVPLDAGKSVVVARFAPGICDEPAYAIATRPTDNGKGIAVEPVPGVL